MIIGKMDVSEAIHSAITKLHKKIDGFAFVEARLLMLLLYRSLIWMNSIMNKVLCAILIIYIVACVSAGRANGETMNTNTAYPEPFVTGLIDYPNTREGKLHAIADALTAWGNTHMGMPMPEKFGEGMAKISFFLGIIALPDDLVKMADELESAD